MPSLASYCFKPKHGVDVATKIIEHFCDKFLNYSHEGFYLHWRGHDQSVKHRPLPEGWVEFYIDTDNGNLEAWSEMCFWEEEVDGHDLTEKFFALLGDDFWWEDNYGVKQYTMYERELFEVVAALCEDNSRVIAWGPDRTTYISYQNHKGERGVKHLDMLEYAMTVPLDDEEKDDRQFTLDLG